MYYSIIEKDRFYVSISDGVAEETIMELPTEELADEVLSNFNWLGTKVNLGDRTL